MTSQQLFNACIESGVDRAQVAAWTDFKRREFLGMPDPILRCQGSTTEPSTKGIGMYAIPNSLRSNPSLHEKLMTQHGFIMESDVDAIESVDRFIQVLVRCNGGRFTCAIQNVKHFVSIIGEHYNMKEAACGTTYGLAPAPADWVRDISFVA